MTARLVALGIDAHDPIGLARFYATALGWDVDAGTPGAVAVVPTDATRFRLVLRPTTARKVGPNRLHLDLTTTSREDQRRSVADLLAAGGRHVDIGQRPDEPHVVLADPEGNELCIIDPDNQFLAGCERLGSITCDGTREVGHFWSAALGWPLVWDQDEETAIRAPDRRGPLITWGGPPVAPKADRNRLHLELEPADGTSVDAEARRLVSLGAVDVGRTAGGGRELLDPDGNELVLLDVAAPSRS